MKKLTLLFILCTIAHIVFANNGACQESEIEDIAALKAEIANLSKTLENLNSRLKKAEEQVELQKQNSQKKI